jgi:hypothetical protein
VAGEVHRFIHPENRRRLHWRRPSTVNDGFR